MNDFQVVIVVVLGFQDHDLLGLRTQVVGDLDGVVQRSDSGIAVIVRSLSAASEKDTWGKALKDNVAFVSVLIR